MKRYRRTLQLCMLLLGSISYPVNASIQSDLDHFFDSLSVTSNVTSPAAFESQAAGFFGGGSLYTRSPVRQVQLVQLDLPDYRAGCGGIDLFTGSLSFLSEQKLADLGRAVMTNAPAYAADVMLASTVPVLKQVRDYLQQLEQAVNQASINSCQLSQNLVGGLWPKTAESQQKICKDQAAMGQEGLFSDYVKARMACSGNGFNQVMQQASKDKHRQKQVVLNKNIVWDILQTKSFFHGDKQLAELVMSLTGTFIINAHGQVTQVPALSNHPQLLQALLGEHQEPINLWHCQDTSCLSVARQTINLPASSTLKERIAKVIQSLQDKLLNDKNPTNEEINFLNLTHLPILKFLTVLASSQAGLNPADLQVYASLIAQDLLTHYLQGLLHEVEQATLGAEFQDDLIKAIQNRIYRALQQVGRFEPKVHQSLQEKLALIEHIRHLEKQVAVDITRPTG